MHTGLLLVDIQNDYFPQGRMELVGMEEAASKAKDLLTLFRGLDWPVFHIQHVSKGDAASFFIEHSKGVQTFNDVKPILKEPVVVKHYPNSFRETTLHEDLKKADIKRVIICGAMSHMCIDATTRAATDLGYKCVVIHDACATKDLTFQDQRITSEAVHGAFMSALGAYGKVMRLDEFAASV